MKEIIGKYILSRDWIVTCPYCQREYVFSTHDTIKIPFPRECPMCGDSFMVIGERKL